VRFEWDEQKNASNLRKHGVSFELAATIFDDPLHISEPDRIVHQEQRWKTIGEVNGKYLLVVAHTVESEEMEVVRIISAREADPHERREYEGDV
jgi:uncharacterized DUF497 family protein